MAVCQNLVPLVNIKIAGKWMFIPLKIVLIGIDPYPYISTRKLSYWVFSCFFNQPPCWFWPMAVPQALTGVHGGHLGREASTKTPGEATRMRNCWFHRRISSKTADLTCQRWWFYLAKMVILQANMLVVFFVMCFCQQKHGDSCSKRKPGACLSKDGGFKRKDGDFNDDFVQQKNTCKGDEFACKQGYCLRKNWWLSAKMNTLPAKIRWFLPAKIRWFLPAKIRCFFQKEMVILLAKHVGLPV